MAHFLEYKTLDQVLPFEVSFEQLLTDDDTQLDLQKCKDALVVTDSAGTDKKDTLVKGVAVSGKVLTLTLGGGAEGEDYTLFIKGLGDVSFLTVQPVRVLEVRVRNKLIGNL